MKRMLQYGIVALLALGQPAALAAPPAAPPPQNDPAVQMRRDQEQARRQEAERELERQREAGETGVEDKRGAQEKTQESESLRFQLKRVDWGTSEVLAPEEVEAIVGRYEGREVSVEELYALVEEINALYQKKGFVVCRAVLPEQTIKKGVVKILLIEGKTGEVFVEGNRSTKEAYIRERLALREGEVSNLAQLNWDLLWFNGTNDVQLRIEMRAGAQTGTTDYHIVAWEPPKARVTLFSDNAGSESTGQWRGGVSYVHASLSGRRDALALTLMESEGSQSGAVGYTYPINARGTSLSFNYSANSIEIIDGALREMDVRGHSEAWGVALRHPLVVDRKRRAELSLEVQQQQSETDFMDMKWVDEDISDVTAAVTLTNYEGAAVFYQRHSYTSGRWKDQLGGERKSYGRYNFSGIFQRAAQGKQLLTVRLNGQYSADDYLPSAEQFYIGGMYSVRGYKESFLGADSGFTASVEYALPLAENERLLLFVEGGGVFGDNAFRDHTALGAGVGYRAQIGRDASANLSVGFPLKRGYESHAVGRARAHFFVSGTL